MEANSQPKVKLDELGYEILDIIFSYFSTNAALSDNYSVSNAGRGGLAYGETGTAGGSSSSSSSSYSSYQTQLDLLNFCMVSRRFYQVARWVVPPRA